MPDTPEEKPAHPLSDMMDMVTGREDNTKASWPVSFFLIAGLVIALAVIGIKLALAKRKAAELASRIRKVEEEKKQAEENLKLEKNAQARSAAKEEIKALSKEILTLKAQMAKRMSNHEETIKDLESVTSWDEIEVVNGRDL